MDELELPLRRACTSCAGRERRWQRGSSFPRQEVFQGPTSPRPTGLLLGSLTDGC